jgi:uncharacterized protein YqgQ
LSPFTSFVGRLKAGVLMKTIYDVQQLLKKFGIILYVGERVADLELMEMEIIELNRMQLLGKDVFHNAILLLRMEIEKEKKRKKGEWKWKTDGL